MGRGNSEQIKFKKERVKQIRRIIQNGIYQTSEIKQLLEKKFSWFSEVSIRTIEDDIVRAKNQVRDKARADYLIEFGFVKSELIDIMTTAQQTGDIQNRIKALQEMAKVLGLYDNDMKKILVYKEQLEKAEQEGAKQAEQSKHIASVDDILKEIEDNEQ
jgi:regulator of replication initiation timing